MEDEGHIALDLVLQQGLTCLDALPGRGQLDQDPVGAHARLLVEGDDALGPPDGLVLVEGQPRINFGRHESLDLLQQFDAEGDAEVVEDELNELELLLRGEF